MENKCAKEKLIDEIDSEMQMQRIEFVYHSEIYGAPFANEENEQDKKMW